MKINKTILATLMVIIFFIAVYIAEPIIINNIKVITAISLFGIIIAGSIYMKIKDKLTIKNIIIIAIIIGILIRAMYIIYTPITERQHDVYSINDEGHLGYIYQIYETGQLPKTNHIQFYHPPLFHLTGAGWLRINSLLNISLNRSIEGLQVLTAIFSSLILICSYKITEHLKIKDIYKLLINLIMIFHPTFIILSGSINNDVLMIFLTFMIILYLIKWREKTNIKNTIILAVITGLAVMAKVSAAIMAVPILYIFIDKYIEEFKKRKKILNWNFILLMIIFGLISLPIGLWHPIRNLILFEQPIGGVLIPGEALNVSNYTFTERFLTVSYKELVKETFAVLPGDYNILAYIIKSSIFGEYSYNNIAFFAFAFKAINIIIILTSVICSIKSIFSKDRNNKHIINILLITWIINVLSYYYFNIKYPYSCTMDFRYLVPTIYTGIVAICNTLNDAKRETILSEVIQYIFLIFCVLSIVMFFAI